MSGFFAVRNFEKFQHYKDRNPPWIRLYNTLLDDYEFGRLPDASKAHLLAIWLLASRYENKIPFDTEWVSRRINATDQVDLNTLAEGGFIVPDQDCNAALAPRKQFAVPETEERQRREEAERKNTAPSLRSEAVGVEPSEDDEEEIPAVLDRRRYPEAFEALWHEYQPIASKNATKADAHRAWERLSRTDRDDCWTGLIRYVMWLEDERRKRADTPAKHLSTFINKRGWEPFLATETGNGIENQVVSH